MIFRSRLPDIEMPNVDLATYVFEQGKKEYNSSLNRKGFAVYDEDSGQGMSIEYLEKLSSNFASGLINKLNFHFDDTLMLFAPNSANFVVSLFGTLMAGGIVTFANPSYTHNELSHQINDSKPKFIATSFELLDVAKKAIIGSKQNIPPQNIIIIDYIEPKVGSYTLISNLYDTRAYKRFVIEKGQDADKKVAFLPYSSGTT
ncbi:hypothetical protein BB560_003983, partial [Smittium megazygosporum]